jgi:hypothetical protein
VHWHANNVVTVWYSAMREMQATFFSIHRLFYCPITRKVAKFSCCLTKHETHNTHVTQAVMLAALLKGTLHGVDASTLSGAILCSLPCHSPRLVAPPYLKTHTPVCMEFVMKESLLNYLIAQFKLHWKWYGLLEIV